MLPANLKEFIYFDRDGIDSFHAQIVERLEISRTDSQSNTASGDLSASAGMKAFLLGLLPIGEGAVSGTLSGKKSTTSSVTSSLSNYDKLKAVIDVLGRAEYGICFPNLADAVLHASENDESVFFCGTHKFDAPQYAAGAPREELYNATHLYLQHSPRYQHRDDYFKYPPFKAIMSCSVSKMPRSSNGLSLTSHEAVYFRGYNGMLIPIGVFCSVKALPEVIQLKPFALWI